MRQAVMGASMADKLARGAFVHDVREPDECAAGHLRGAQHPAAGARSGSRAARPVHVTSPSGNRSTRAAERIAALGVEAVPLAGGTAVWVRAGRPLVRGNVLHAAV
ncbi:rhodanese-like domain-containing protein [Streptomyces sp. NPDC049906]|uniref:rhodanese-like domain-containing protein n=1 Tax=Streptomyces sp. NPDC049906 TaxID=3155656 RepID=UPI0034202989